ncbi:prepilin-type N-terminal cleavage/methylation domain-containing protein [Cyanobium sp. CH-040]|uniref:prepilin-type N-terminal cleavage/methylation domain-containing protein n=1 Tax=Cyanobium sp. CH-040 TaxID=2823708 RepID=UPI0020CE2D66|nr:prepilin-type N-terminal cleavage/methylation domain-containing protein [Cyanobium sp. CH-040]MCP9926335.1 prepilin-type N-terminal cleavage/methylation domain-containing protein [Cyanobium sp. CH-040]
MAIANISFSQAPERLLRGKKNAGFTLVEVLASAVILLVATVGAIVAFNLITQSVRGTGSRADQSRRIDEQIAEINRLSEIYTSCGTPEGAVPSNLPTLPCAGSTTDVQVGNSFYYFPDPANTSFVARFFSACRSSAESGHITAGFVSAIDGIPPGADTLDGGVSRRAAERVNPSDASNHLVEVIWEDELERPLRTVRIAPIVSSWCP